MEMWDTHESTRPDDLIRPRREEILKLKKALREKYPREEAQFQFDDGESETQSYFVDWLWKFSQDFQAISQANFFTKNYFNVWEVFVEYSKVISLAWLERIVFALVSFFIPALFTLSAN